MAATNGLAGIGTRGVAKVPEDQQIVAPMIITIPHSAVPAGWLPGSARTAMPTKPSAVPAMVARRGVSRASRRRQTSQSGTSATSRAARPEGTVCSATATPPLPQVSSSTPTTPADSNRRGGTRRTPGPWRTARNAASRIPAHRNRTPIASNGGTNPTRTRIPR